MAKRRTSNVSLTPELDRFVAERVASGKYQSASEVVRAGLRLLQEREGDADLAAVRRKIASGLEQARRGELLDGDGVFAEIDAMLGASAGRGRRRRAG